VYHLAPSVNIGFLPYILRSCLKKWYSTRERFSHVTNAWPDMCLAQVHMQSIANSHDRLSGATFRQQKYRPDKASPSVCLSVRYLSAPSLALCISVPISRQQHGSFSLDWCQGFGCQPETPRIEIRKYSTYGITAGSLPSFFSCLNNGELGQS